MKKDFLTITPDSGGGTTNITVAADQNQGNARSAQITISGGIARTVSVSQSGAVISYKYRVDPKLITVSNAQYSSVTSTIIMYKEKFINGESAGEEQIEYSLLDQNGSYAPVTSATYKNVWGGTWTIEKTGNSLKVTTISGGGNPSGGISGVRLMPGTSYAGTINTDLNLGRPRS